MKKNGPFYDFTSEQWEEVRRAHHRFCEDRDVGHPLFIPTNGLQLPDISEDMLPHEEITLAGPKKRNEKMDEAIRFWIRMAHVLSQSEYRGASFPRLYIAREFYGHSQRLAEPFGTTTLVSSGHAQARPAIHSLSSVHNMRLKAVKDCLWLSRSLETLRYFHESTEGRYYIPHMVTTGPCDTVNYATGTTLLLQGFYESPKAVHQLLRMATDITIEHIQECKKIAGDRLIPDHTYLLDGCYCLCSEIRCLYSREHYEEFDAPYLKEIGEAVGPLHIQASGPVDQSMEPTATDPNIRHMKIWLRDSDLGLVARTIGDRISLDFFENTCMPALSFESKASFYRHIFENIRPETRWVISNYDARPYNQAYDQMEQEGVLPEQIRKLGRL